MHKLKPKLTDYFNNANHSISGSCCDTDGKCKITSHIIINSYILTNTKYFENGRK